jgi:diaminopropionate ammonia-lyase
VKYHWSHGKYLKNSAKHCISLPDDDIAKTMKLLGNSSFSDDKIIAGENSAPGVISLIGFVIIKQLKKIRTK